MRGGFHYFKEDASVMVSTVNWKYDYRETLNNYAKTTIIFGDYDFLDFNGAVHQALIKGYENIKFKLINSAGHNIWIDEPKKYKTELDKALKR
jgi:pimeloyl-ACP methyl ester carboxylesterase